MTKSPYEGSLNPLNNQLSKLYAKAQAMISPQISTLPIKALENKSPAKWMYERLCMSINEFEEDLDQDHEVGARLVSFGTAVTFHINNLAYWGPDIIKFYGVTDDGNRVELIQHISQLSVLLIAMKKRGEKARRIGFNLVANLKKE